MIEKLRNNKGHICVIGLGYVGLPLAIELSSHFPVFGYDVNAQKVAELQRLHANLEFTANAADLNRACCFIVAVPTPIDHNNLPVLAQIESATETIAGALKPGDYVIYESTVFPGCTQEVCIPLLEQGSGLKCGVDFKVCYSPERISPGETAKDITSIVKVISACDEDALAELETLYDPVTNGLYKASSMKVAEMAKLVENVQRDVNISLINEFAMICDKLEIDTHEVLDAAASKWNFQRFTPGLVGGHCISVDPYYLVYKSRQMGHVPRVILSGRDINDNMPGFIASKLLKKLLKHNKNIADCRVLVMGITYKPNVDDIRNSKVVDLIRELESYSVSVDVIDPLASSDEVKSEYALHLDEAPSGKYDAIIMAVPHDEFTRLGQEHYNTHLNGARILIDISGTMNGRIENMDYWRL